MMILDRILNFKTFMKLGLLVKTSKHIIQLYYVLASKT